MNNVISQINIKNNFKKYISAFVYSFMIGLLISSIPYLYKMIEKYKIQKLIEKEKQIQIQEKEKQCKDINSDYRKFLNLGFPNTAIEKLTICMKEK